MLKIIAAFLWNKLPFLRKNLPIAVKCLRCDKIIRGREQIEKWIYSWHFCEDCARQFINGVMFNDKLSPETKTKIMLSKMPVFEDLSLEDWDEIFKNTITKTFDIDVVLKSSVKNEFKISAITAEAKEGA